MWHNHYYHKDLQKGSVVNKTEKKLEMRGRAQRKATRHCASDWGHNL